MSASGHFALDPPLDVFLVCRMDGVGVSRYFDLDLPPDIFLPGVSCRGLCRFTLYDRNQVVEIG